MESDKQMRRRGKTCHNWQKKDTWQRHADKRNGRKQNEEETTETETSESDKSTSVAGVLSY